jgi:hypothetical protein
MVYILVVHALSFNFWSRPFPFPACSAAVATLGDSQSPGLRSAKAQTLIFS